MSAVDRDHDRPSALGLEEHLGRYYGIDGLRNAVDQLKAMRKGNETRIKRIKDANSRQAPNGSPSCRAMWNRQHAKLWRPPKDIRPCRTESIGQGSGTASRPICKSGSTDRSAWAQAAGRLAARVSADFGRPVAVSSLERALDERQADLDRKIETVRVEVAVNVAKEAALDCQRRTPRCSTWRLPSLPTTT